MYNGIGLQTARGSGTNGYVTRNLSSVRRHKRAGYEPKSAAESNPLKAAASQGPNKDLLEHERKRKIELQLVEFQDELEEQGLDENEIEARVDKERARLNSQQEKKATVLSDRELARTATESHVLSAVKEREDARVAAALGIDSNHVVGAAFDKELQERKKIERMQERERQEKERARGTKKRKRRRSYSSSGSYSYSGSYSGSYSSSESSSGSGSGGSRGRRRKKGRRSSRSQSGSSSGGRRSRSRSASGSGSSRSSRRGSR